MATRIKTKTLAAVPQSKNDCAQSIRLLGDLQREFERERAAMNDAIDPASVIPSSKICPLVASL